MSTEGFAGDSSAKGEYLSKMWESMPTPVKMVRALFRTEGGMGWEKIQEEFKVDRGMAHIANGISKAIGADEGIPAIVEIGFGVVLKMNQAGNESEDGNEESDEEPTTQAPEEEWETDGEPEE